MARMAQMVRRKSRGRSTFLTMKTDIKSSIVKYLKEHPTGEWGGNLEDYIRSTAGAKGDTTARRLRELVESERIMCFKKIPPNGKRPVNYYLIREMPKVSYSEKIGLRVPTLF